MRTVIAHGHIFKNAGSTLDWSLKRNFGKGFCDHRDDVPMRRQGADYLNEFLKQNPQIQALSSHHLCDTSPIEDLHVIPIYLLRHPIERVLSVYNFERKQKANTPGAIAAKKYNFKDYVKWRMEPSVNRTIRDYQTLYLAGQHTVGNGKDVDKIIFERALKKLSQTQCVGIVEMFDESMCVFEEELRSYFPKIDLSYIKQNAAILSVLGRRSSVQAISEELGEVFDLLLANNSFDLALYRVVRQELEKKVFVSSFRQPLRALRVRCGNHR